MIVQYQTVWTAKWALYSPEQVAVKEFESGKRLSYRALNAVANRLAHYLCGTLSLVKGNRIAVLADNCIEYIALFAAAQKTGIILVPLNYRLTSPEIDYMLENSAPELLVYEEKYASLLEPCAQLS